MTDIVTGFIAGAIVATILLATGVIVSAILLAARDAYEYRDEDTADD